MPPTGKLPDEKIAAFEKWIAAGAPDPREDAPESSNAAPAAAKRGMDIETGRKWWAFQPVAPQPQPNFKDSAFAKRWTRRKDRRLHSCPAGAEQAAALAGGRSRHSHPARLARSDRACVPLTKRFRPSSPIKRSEGVREADRPPAGFAALWRAMGTLLAGCGPLRRRQSHVGSHQSRPIRLPGGIAIGSSRRSTKTFPTTSSSSCNWRPI